MCGEGRVKILISLSYWYMIVAFVARLFTVLSPSDVFLFSFFLSFHRVQVSVQGFISRTHHGLICD